jgi:hypothetical protein
MPNLSQTGRDVWLWLLQDGGAWTVAEMAQATRRKPNDLFDQLQNMAAKGTIEKMPPALGSRRLRYAVTGTCKVPQGMCVAEVQAE